MKAMNWQSIETAPKDGSRILLFGTVHIRGANYIDTEPLWIVGRYTKIGKYAEHAKEWEADPTDYATIEIRPTHWMPLPKPPQEP